MTITVNPPPRVLMLLGDTITRFRRTGVQRVAIEAARGLAIHAQLDFVRWDYTEGRLRFLDIEELDALFGAADWPAGVSVRPEARNVGRPFREHLYDPVATWLLIPEVGWHEDNGVETLARAVAHCQDWGGRVAFIFYDLIPITNPLYADSAEPHEAYLVELTRADLVIPISEDSGQALSRFWDRRAIAPHPPIAPLLLPDGGFGPSRAIAQSPNPVSRTIVLLGTVEPRKRQVEFLRSMEKARRSSSEVSEYNVVVIGSLHPHVANDFNTMVRRNGWLTHLDYASDADVHRLLRDAAFTVFASDDEGYGLPISESLAFGTPCLCANHGSMAEIAAGGGCLTVDVRDESALEEALIALCERPAILQNLRAEIAERRFRSWADYGRELVDLFAKAERGVPAADVRVAEAPGKDLDFDAEVFERLAVSDVAIFPDEAASAAFIAEARRRHWPALLPSRLMTEDATDTVAALARQRHDRHKLALSERAYAKARRCVPAAFKTRPIFLRILISTYNRRDFVVLNVRWLLKKILNLVDFPVEVVVVDGGSTDGTVDALFTIGDSRLTIIESPANVGMLSGLREAARLPGAEYVWLVGDDDLIRRDGFRGVVDGLLANPGVAFAFTNFSVYHRAALDSTDMAHNLILQSTPVAQTVAPSGILKVRQAAEQTDNLFTAIYAIVWRADLLCAAYEHAFDGAPFANLTEAIPCTEYILGRYAECDAFWHGGLGIAGNAHNSWSSNRPRWHGAVMPLALALARDAGVDPVLLQSWADLHLGLLYEALEITKANGRDPHLTSDDLTLAQSVFRSGLPAAYCAWAE
jgi:glycosyltransferase involved in cell wall biosynthesis